MKYYLRMSSKMIMCIIISIMIGFVLLVGVYLLPTKQMRYNMAEASEQISQEGQYYQWAKGYKNAQIDTYTDASLYLNAIYPEADSIQNAITSAMNVPRLLYGDDNNEESVVLFAQESEGNLEEIQYGRYWHGSLVLLKPLLLFLDLGDIRTLGMMVQFALIFLSIIGFTKQGKTKEIVGFFCALMMLNPITMVLGFCFSIEYILMLLMVTVMVWFHDQLLVGNRYYFFFLFSGILFVYFNELSFPMIGLGIPLVVYLVFSRETTKTLLKKEFLYSVVWGGGYLTMWIGKWILAWVFTGYNYLAEALGQAERYTSDHATWEMVNPSVVDRLLKNICVYMKWPYFFMLLGVFCVFVIWIVKSKHGKWNRSFGGMIPYLLPLVMPFAIFVVLGNGYSYVHYWFTHRLLAICIFAGTCMLLRGIEVQKKKE